MTLAQARKHVLSFNGYGKTEADFTAMMHGLSDNGISLLDGKIAYNDDMSSKRYQFRLALDALDEDGSYLEGKTIGWLVAYKCFVRGLDAPYEILAYVS